MIDNKLDLLYPGLLRCSLSLFTHPIEQIKIKLHTCNHADKIKFWMIPKWISQNKGSTHIVRYLYNGYPVTLLSLAIKGIYKYPILICGPRFIGTFTDNTENTKIAADKINMTTIFNQVALAPVLLFIDTVMQAPQRRLKYITMAESLGRGQSSTMQTIKFLFNPEPHLDSRLKVYKNIGGNFWHGSNAYFIKHGIGQVSLLASDAFIREWFRSSGHSTAIDNPSYVAAIGLNGLILTAATNPLDVVLSRINSSPNHLENKPFFGTMLNIVKNEGAHVLFRGTSLRLIPRTLSIMYTSLVISWSKS